MIERALVKSYTATNHTATVQLLEGPQSLLTLPVLTQCPARHLTTDREVAILTWPDVGAMVIGPWTPTGDRILHAYAQDTTARTFTAQTYTLYPNLTCTITIYEPAYLLIIGMANGSNSASRATAFAASTFLNNNQLSPFAVTGCTAGYWQNVNLTLRTTLQNAGTHTIDMRIYVYTGGDTTTMRYASLTVLTLYPEP